MKSGALFAAIFSAIVGFGPLGTTASQAQDVRIRIGTERHYDRDHVRYRYDRDHVRHRFVVKERPLVRKRVVVREDDECTTRRVTKIGPHGKTTRIIKTCS